MNERTQTMMHPEKHPRINLVFILTTGMLSIMTTFVAAQSVRILPELPGSAEYRKYTISENDSTVYDVNLTFDETGFPLYYFRNVFTPVCYTEVCKPVYIDMYWDLLGNYLGFEVPAHEPLTKTDHKEFEEEDYQKLHNILANTQSLLQDFTIYELVDTRTYNLSDSVDAVTGATPKTIKNEVIGGAVYTCYTLWHIVNGPVMEELQKITESHSSNDLMKNFLRSENHHYQYWALDRTIAASEETPDDILPDILNIIQGKNIFTARYALDKIPADVFSSSDSLQSWLWSVYQQSNYTLQLAILGKLKQIRLSDAVAISVSRALANTNEQQFKLMLELFEPDQLSAATISELAIYLDHADPSRAAAVYKILSEANTKDSEVRKKLKRYERSNAH